MLILVLYLAPNYHGDVIGSWLTGLRNGAVSLEQEPYFQRKNITLLLGMGPMHSLLASAEGLEQNFLFKQLKINNSFTVQCEWNSHQDLRVSRRLIILLTIWQTLRQLPGWQHWVPVELARGHPSLRELLFQCSPKPNTFRNDTGEKAANEDSGNKIQYKNWWIAQQFSSRIFKI